VCCSLTCSSAATRSCSSSCLCRSAFESSSTHCQATAALPTCRHAASCCLVNTQPARSCALITIGIHPSHPQQPAAAAALCAPLHLLQQPRLLRRLHLPDALLALGLAGGLCARHRGGCGLQQGGGRGACSRLAAATRRGRPAHAAMQVQQRWQHVLLYTGRFSRQDGRCKS
jgi:hypothetical protein